MLDGEWSYPRASPLFLTTYTSSINHNRHYTHNNKSASSNLHNKYISPDELIAVISYHIMIPSGGQNIHITNSLI